MPVCWHVPFAFLFLGMTFLFFERHPIIITYTETSLRTGTQLAKMTVTNYILPHAYIRFLLGVEVFDGWLPTCTIMKMNTHYSEYYNRKLVESSPFLDDVAVTAQDTSVSVTHPLSLLL